MFKRNNLNKKEKKTAKPIPEANIIEDKHKNESTSFKIKPKVFGKGTDIDSKKHKDSLIPKKPNDQQEMKNIKSSIQNIKKPVVKAICSNTSNQAVTTASNSSKTSLKSSTSSSKIPIKIKPKSIEKIKKSLTFSIRNSTNKTGSQQGRKSNFETRLKENDQSLRSNSSNKVNNYLNKNLSKSHNAIPKLKILPPTPMFNNQTAKEIQLKEKVSEIKENNGRTLSDTHLNNLKNPQANSSRKSVIDGSHSLALVKDKNPALRNSSTPENLMTRSADEKLAKKAENEDDSKDKFVNPDKHETTHKNVLEFNSFNIDRSKSTQITSQNQTSESEARNEDFKEDINNELNDDHFDTNKNSTQKRQTFSPETSATVNSNTNQKNIYLNRSLINSFQNTEEDIHKNKLEKGEILLTHPENVVNAVPSFQREVNVNPNNHIDDRSQETSNCGAKGARLSLPRIRTKTYSIDKEPGIFLESEDSYCSIASLCLENEFTDQLQANTSKRNVQTNSFDEGTNTHKICTSTPDPYNDNPDQFLSIQKMSTYLSPIEQEEKILKNKFSECIRRAENFGIQEIKIAKPEISRNGNVPCSVSDQSDISRKIRPIITPPNISNKKEVRTFSRKESIANEVNKKVDYYKEYFLKQILENKKHILHGSDKKNRKLKNYYEIPRFNDQSHCHGAEFGESKNITEFESIESPQEKSSKEVFEKVKKAERPEIRRQYDFLTQENDYYGPYVSHIPGFVHSCNSSVEENISPDFNLSQFADNTGLSGLEDLKERKRKILSDQSFEKSFPLHAKANSSFSTANSPDVYYSLFQKSSDNESVYGLSSCVESQSFDRDPFLSKTLEEKNNCLTGDTRVEDKLFFGECYVDNLNQDAAERSATKLQTNSQKVSQLITVKGDSNDSVIFRKIVVSFLLFLIFILILILCRYM